MCQESLGNLCVMIPNLHMRKPWLREVKFFAQGCTACKINSKPCVCPIVMCCFVTNCWTFLSGCWVKYLPLYELVLCAHSWKPSCTLENVCHEALENTYLRSWAFFLFHRKPLRTWVKALFLGILRKLNGDLMGDN